MTTSSYNILGQAITSETTVPGQVPSITVVSYNLNGQVETATVDGTLLADPAYDNFAQLSTVALGNGTSLSAIERAATGSLTAQTWSFPGQDSYTDSVYRSQSGRIVAGTVTDGTVSTSSTYAFDGAGRLVTATIPEHTLTYQYADTGSCGLNPGAGLNGNRTASTDQASSGTQTTTYCYDQADRLTSSGVVGPVGGLNPVAAGIAPTGVSYDSHGNTTTLADQTMIYDSANRHLSTTLTDGTKVEYVRDATDRVVARTETPAGGTATTIRFGFTGGGDAPALVLNGLNALLQRTLALPGGVTVQIPTSGDQVWSYPDLHGDVGVVANQAGNRVGALFAYDPFGQSIDPITGRIGTITADKAVPDNLPGSADNAWVGGHQKLYEHLGDIATIEMGARQYVAALGRFLGVDPVEGGNANDFVYPTDPINKLDLSGQQVYCLCGYNIRPIVLVAASTGRAVSSRGGAAHAGPRKAKAARPAAPKNNGWDIAGMVLGVAAVALFVVALSVASPVVLALAVVVSVTSTVIACRKGIDVGCVISAVGTLAGGMGAGIKLGAFGVSGVGMGAEAAEAGLSSFGVMADTTGLTVSLSKYGSQGW